MKYAVPILLLGSTILFFFARGRAGYASFGNMQRVLRVIVALPLFISAALLHFLKTDLSASMIPPVFPARHFLVLLTGALEMAGAIGLFLPFFRRPAAFWISILMVAIFPANVYAAGKVMGGLAMPGVPLRTAMQIIYIVLVLLAGFGIPGRTQIAWTETRAVGEAECQGPH
jgi:uncharacterized membrane protein